MVVTEGSAGTLNFKKSKGIKTTEKTISLGEEHSETLPNGEITRGITVREGDSNLITRCESKTLGKMELIREFSKEGMTLVIRGSNPYKYSFNIMFSEKRFPPREKVPLKEKESL